MKKLSEIFDVWYGVNMEMINCEESENGVPFVSRTSHNNGIVGYVKESEIAPNPEHTISVACSGSVLATFYHPYKYYSGRDVYVLKPKISLSEKEMIFFCAAIEKNKYRYNYGRQANKTLRDILIPSVEEMPEAIKDSTLNNNFDKTSLINYKLSLNTSRWKWFHYSEIFNIKKGLRLTSFDMEYGTIPYVASGNVNNGIVSFVKEKTNSAGCITFACYGSIGECFYHDYDIWASDNVNVITLKERKLNRYIGIFLVTLFNKEKYRFSYGLTAKISRLVNFNIKLPITSSGNPDWQFMEDYIKSLPYSASL